MILDEDADMVRVEFPYSKSFVEEFKSTIPYPGRQWDKNSKCWLVHIDLIDEARAMLLKQFGSVSMNRRLEAELKRRVAEEDMSPVDPDDDRWWA